MRYGNFVFSASLIWFQNPKRKVQMFTQFYTVYRSGINLLFIEAFKQAGNDNTQLFISTTDQYTGNFLMELGNSSSHPIHVEIHHGQTYINSAKSHIKNANGALLVVKDSGKPASETQELIKYAKGEGCEVVIIDFGYVKELDASEAGKRIHNSFQESSLKTLKGLLVVLGEEGFDKNQESKLISCLKFMF